MSTKIYEFMEKRNKLIIFDRKKKSRAMISVRHKFLLNLWHLCFWNGIFTLWNWTLSIVKSSCFSQKLEEKGKQCERCDLHCLQTYPFGQLLTWLWNPARNVSLVWEIECNCKTAVILTNFSLETPKGSNNIDQDQPHSFLLNVVSDLGHHCLQIV